MKYGFLMLFFLAAMQPAIGQSNTTNDLQKKYDETMTLFFYKNTLRMINQQENKEFDEMIQNIEKMEFILVDRNKSNFGKAEYKELIGEYQKERFESIVTSRIEGRNFDVFLRDAKGSKPGTVVLVSDSSNLYILDIVGTIDISKVGSLFNKLGVNEDVSTRIRRFVDPESDTTRRRRRSSPH